MEEDQLQDCRRCTFEIQASPSYRTVEQEVKGEISQILEEFNGNTMETQTLPPPQEEMEEQASVWSQYEEVAWILRFDRSYSKKGAGIGFKLTSPDGEMFLIARQLQFPYTNNVAEYELLVHGLLFAISKGAKMVQAYGDSEIVVKQVRKKYVCHDKRLSHYCNKVWDLLESFDAINIRSVGRVDNQIANTLAQAASSLEPLTIGNMDHLSIELSLNPLIPNNITNFQVFEDNGQIQESLTSLDIFIAQMIDEEEIKEEAELDDDRVLNLKKNFIPKGMIQLEIMYDQDQINEMKR
ncbi:uncharacterized protein LOC131079900 [Cryptomeria japonica]|uniref:uncharacterized protein LOC131079900 n=1 Tax=Cryptomeria japonica TaxID=3369 RepID=UPI0027DAA25C|nr:uncharacterized protein LOC131079900 [Cryptomeria japonica]